MTTTPIEPTPSKKYDAIVVGSGAAGGMAAFVAGDEGRKGAPARGRPRRRPATKNRRRWSGPTRAQFRADIPPTEHAINVAEYNMLDRPYGMAKRDWRRTRRYIGTRPTGTRSHWIVTTSARTRSRARRTRGCARASLGGKTLIWGRVRAEAVGPGLQGEDARRLRRRLADRRTTTSRRATTRSIACWASRARWRTCRRLPDGIFQRPMKLTCGEQIFKKTVTKMGRHLIPGRAGVTTDGLVHNRYRSRCMGRGRCGRGCDISGDLPLAERLCSIRRRTRAISTIRTDSRRLGRRHGRVSTNRAKGVRVIDGRRRRRWSSRRRRWCWPPPRWRARGCCWRPSRGRYPEWPGELVGRGRPLLLRAHHGSERQRLSADAEGPRSDARRWASGAAVYPPLPKSDGQTSRFRSRLSTSRVAAACQEYPGHAHGLPGFGAAFKKNVRDWYPTPNRLRRLRRSARAEGEPGRLDPKSRMRGACRRCRFDYKFGDNEMKMVEGHGQHGIEEMLHEAGAEDIQIGRDIADARAGRSTRWARRAWATTPRPRS